MTGTADYDARLAALAALLDAARADGWDAGYQRGLRDAEQDVQHGADNPYRVTPPESS